MKRLAAFLFLLATPVWAEPIISEFMADNLSAKEDNKRLFSDWIELHNLDATSVNLAGYTLLTDKGDLADLKANIADPNRPNKKAVGWQFPEGASLNAGGYLVVWCSGLTITDTIAATDTSPAQVHHHTNFQLSSGGDYLALVSPKGDIVSEVPKGLNKETKYEDQYPNYSYGQKDGKWGYFEAPSPGEVNGATVEGPPSKVDFKTKGGTFKDAFKAELTHPDLNAADAAKAVEIRYTTDATEPLPTSTLYTSPIDIAATTHLRARAYRLNTKSLPGKQSSENYIQVAADLADFTTNLGLVVVDTFGVNVDTRGKTPKNKSMLVFFDTDPKTGRSSPLGTPFSAVYGGVARRGESSLDMFQKQYGLEIWDELGQDKAEKLMDGFPADSDFTLYGPATDKTLMRNFLSFNWHNRMGHYTVKTKYVEMYMNVAKGQPVSAAHYKGVFLLVERIKRGSNRVNIKVLEPQHQTEPDISGGYIFRRDKEDGVEHKLISTVKDKVPLQIVEPETTLANKKKFVPDHQVKWFKAYMDAFETALYGANFGDPNEGYAKYIDVGAFIDNHLLIETAKNIDGYRISNYMAKDRGGKIFNVSWDFNLSLGNANYNDGWLPAGWYWKIYLNSKTEYPWYPQLFKDPEFTLQHQDRWFELRRSIFESQTLLKEVDDTINYLEEAAGRHYNKYKRLAIYDWPNPNGFAQRKTYREEVLFLRNWLERRLLWMDRQFEEPVSFSAPSGIIASGTALTLNPDLPEVVPPPAGSGQTALGATEKYPVKPRPGKIYYTTDGTDPRLRGGSVSPTAKSYDAPLTIEASTRIRARLLQDSGAKWTALAEASYVVGQPATAQNLIVSEVHYNPAAPTEAEKAAGISDGDEFEFIEFLNVGATQVQLAGVKFTNGVEFSFDNGAVSSLAPGERALVVANKAAFEKRYGAGLPVVGQFTTGNLRDSGEPLAIEGITKDDPATPAKENLIASFQYSDGSTWPKEADGGGYSLVLGSEKAGQDLSLASSWKKSAALNGSPGKAEPAGPPAGGGYEAWKRTVFTGAELAGDISGDKADGDGDGLTTFMEYFLNGNPKQAEKDLLTASTLRVGQSDYLALTFPVSKSVADVKYVVEVSSDLKTWKTSDSVVEASVKPNGATDLVTVRSAQPLDSNAQYLRLKISK